MRYAFLGLMCAFTAAYAAVRHKGGLAARLTLKSAASVGFVLIAFAARLDAPEPYFTLILTGLCLSLAGDVLLALPGAAALVAGGVFLLAHLGFIAAFLICAPLKWMDGLLFAAFAALGAAVFPGKFRAFGRLAPFAVLYAAMLCALAAKAPSMLFVHGVSALYASFAALGSMLTALSDTALGCARPSAGEQGNRHIRRAFILRGAGVFGAERRLVTGGARNLTDIDVANLQPHVYNIQWVGIGTFFC